MTNTTTPKARKTAATKPAARPAAVAGMETNPLSILVGGLALGAIAGALLPRTKRETELLGSTGRMLTGTATAALAAAKEVGKEELSALAPSAVAREKAASILGHVLQAAKDAGAKAKAG